MPPLFPNVDAISIFFTYPSSRHHLHTNIPMFSTLPTMFESTFCHSILLFLVPDLNAHTKYITIRNGNIQGRTILLIFSVWLILWGPVVVRGALLEQFEADIRYDVGTDSARVGGGPTI